MNHVHLFSGVQPPLSEIMAARCEEIEGGKMLFHVVACSPRLRELRDN